MRRTTSRRRAAPGEAECDADDARVTSTVSRWTRCWSRFELIGETIAALSYSFPLVDVKHPDERVCTTSLEKITRFPRRGGAKGRRVLWHARGRDARLRRRWRASHPPAIATDFVMTILDGETQALLPRAAPSPPRARVPDPGLAPRASRKPRWAATVTGLVAPAFATLLLLGAALAAAGTSPFATRNAALGDAVDDYLHAHVAVPVDGRNAPPSGWRRTSAPPTALATPANATTPRPREPHTSHTFANLVFSSRSSRGTAAARRCARCTTPGSQR